MVEQRNHNPLVGGPNPSAATRINKRPNGSFFYSVRRGGEGQPDGGPTRRQKADGRMPVPRSYNEGGFAQGNEAQRNQSAALLSYFATLWLRRTGQNFPVFRDFLFRKKFPISSEFVSFSRYIYIF